jgi:hypothetical protein
LLILRKKLTHYFEIQVTLIVGGMLDVTSYAHVEVKRNIKIAMVLDIKFSLNLN